MKTVISAMLVGFAVMGGLCFGDELNTTTGEYIMDMGQGDSLNTTTGEYKMNMGGGDSLNTTTGEYIMDMGP